MSEIDRRRAERIPIGLQIEFDSGTGLSRDVSGLGVYFETESSDFRQGDQISFTMAIPEAVNVTCEGRVVRIDDLEGNRHGIACTIDEFDLAEDAPEAASSHIVIRELREHHPE